MWGRGAHVIQLQSGKLGRGDCCASSSPRQAVQGTLDAGVPVVDLTVSGKGVKGLVDTGCSRTIIRASLTKNWFGRSSVRAFDGLATECRGFAWVDLCVDGVTVKAKVIRAEKLIAGIDVVIGIDVLQRLGSVSFPGGSIVMDRVNGSKVNDGKGTACVADESIHLEDKDFSGVFDGNFWTVQWKWKNGIEPRLTNKVASYTKGLSSESMDAYESEVKRWIDEGILVEWKGKVDGVVPLMAVLQPSKNKVRPVLDFRELNEFVQSHTGGEEVNVCNNKLREWRRTNGELEIVDLQAAYLQIRVCESLWKHQLVEFGGKVFALTRLGFGLNVAPRIMTVVLKRVLEEKQNVKEGTNPYVDDILVNVSKVSTTEVINHLNKYGLRSKPPEKLDGGAALGLKLNKQKDGTLLFRRGNVIPDIPSSVSRRELFSICGKMVGHYPVAGWLRVACSFIKRAASGCKWDDNVGEKARNMLIELRERVQAEDPVKGAWTVPDSHEGIVWCNWCGIRNWWSIG